MRSKKTRKRRQHRCEESLEHTRDFNNPDTGHGSWGGVRNVKGIL